MLMKNVPYVCPCWRTEKMSGNNYFVDPEIIKERSALILSELNGKIYTKLI